MAGSRWRKRLVAAGVIVTALVQLLLVGVLTARVAHAAANPEVTEFPVPGGSPTPFGIVTGPDGNLWFTDSNSSNIGNVTPSGTITEYPLPSNGSAADITAGPDGNLWFADYGASEIGKTTTAGVITEYPVPSANAVDEFITAGPDGSLWFTEGGADRIGRITTGGTISEFPVSSGAGLQYITKGPDGNLWFTERGLDKIGQITPGGTVTEFPITSGAGPNGIVAGPDGNMWFTETSSSRIGRISTSGTEYVEYPIPTASSGPWGITTGPDGNLWFAEVGQFGSTAGDAIGSVTTGGVVTEYTLGTSAGPLGITTGPDGNMWYAGYLGGVIGRLTLGPCASLRDSASAGLVAAGSPETVTVTLTSCGLATLNATTTTTTTVPSGCPAAPAIAGFNSSLTVGQADARPTAFSAPTCPGTYTVNSETTLGATIVATAQATYAVLAVGDGVLYQSTNYDGFPAYLTVGPDGNFWVTAFTSSLFQVTPSGVTTAFPNVFGANSHANVITTGADGNLYVGYGRNIFQVDPRGYPGPTVSFEVPAGATTGYINDVEPGVDGNVWFTANVSTANTGGVGFVSPAGKVKVFKISSGSPRAITAGSDNAMWFTLANSQVGRITPTGAVTYFGVPGSLILGNRGAALGPDGNIWFSGVNSAHQNYVVSISPAGIIHEYATLTPNPSIAGITAGADGNIWFNEQAAIPCSYGSGAVGRVTPAGAMTDFTAGCRDFNDAYNMVAGPDGNVWNVAYYGGGINMTAVDAPASCTPLTVTVAPRSGSRGTHETITTVVRNCGSVPKLITLTSKTTSTCRFTSTAKNAVPLQPLVQTTVSSTSTPTCKGIYTDKLTLSVGNSVVATQKVTYQVT